MRSTHRVLLGAGTAIAVVIYLGLPAGNAAVYKLSAAPVASFIWFPVSPHVGEQVTLVSTSTDLTSPIVRYAWDTSGNSTFGEFVTGGPESKTAFATPAPHAVRLRVTNHEGLSTVATETIRMSAVPVGVIAPFPIVRIVGVRTRTGVRLRLLSVQAPRNSVISVSCQTALCPRALRRARASASGRGTRYLPFRRYARSFHAGSKLEVRVTKRGFIGAFTSFQVKRHKIPRRVDSCLSPAGTKPMRCPA
jgi:hypothetical protein